MKLVTLPSKLLREISKEVDIPLSEKNKKLVEKMINHIDESQNPNSKLKSGIGIAAPQVGYLLKMFYVNIPKVDDIDGFKDFLINPEIIGCSERLAALSGGEGCLSVDFEDKRTLGLVHRYNKVIIKAYSYLSNKEVVITKTGYHAIVLQHELDHLEGKLFIDRIDKNEPWKQKENEILI